MCQGPLDDRKGDAKGRRRIAIGVRLDLVEAALLEGGKGCLPRSRVMPARAGIQ